MEVICMEVHDIKRSKKKITREVLKRRNNHENFQYFEFYNDIIFIFIHFSLLRGIFSTFFIKWHQEEERKKSMKKIFFFISGPESFLYVCQMHSDLFIFVLHKMNIFLVFVEKITASSSWVLIFIAYCLHFFNE